MRKKPIEPVEGIILLEIPEKKRVTLPSKMLNHIDASPGDILIIKLLQNNKVEIKKLDKEALCL